MGCSRYWYNDDMNTKNQPRPGNGMGEIRVKVLLTNAADETANRRRKLKKSAIRRFEADALVDTGAVRSVIPLHVMQALGVMPRGYRMAEYADGRKESVAITEPIIFDMM